MSGRREIRAPAATHEQRRAGEVRVSRDGRTFTARAVAYGIIDDYRTRFVAGVFAEGLRKRLPVITWSHAWDDMIGKVTSYDDRSDGLYITARLSDPAAVPRARQAAAQLAEGVITEVSVGFLRLADRQGDDGITDITKAELDEVALVLRGAVPGAEVLDTYGRRPGDRRTALDRELEAAIDRVLGAQARRARDARDARDAVPISIAEARQRLVALGRRHEVTPPTSNAPRDERSYFERLLGR